MAFTPGESRLESVVGLTVLLVAAGNDPSVVDGVASGKGGEGRWRTS